MKSPREDSALLHLVKPAPRRVGRYEICFELAAGGMATIYLARLEGPHEFKKLVALKCIHPHLVRQAGFVEMFLDEARLASRISHPNVCSVFDFGFADSTYFIAMEFLVGETVGRLCRMTELHRESMPLPTCVGHIARIVADAALGLHAAHELCADDGAFLGLVHRDISPQNIMVSYDGAVKVMDFGIAKTVDQLHLTRTGTLRGKVPYMAPEQVEQSAVNRRADVWSLGVVLWELLTGARLFAREREVDSMRAVLTAPVPAPSSVRREVPKELDEIALRALARNPAQRFATAYELAQALEHARSKREAATSTVALAEWLRGLFPDLYARRLELVNQARQMDDGSIPRISRALSEPTLDTRPVAELSSAPAGPSLPSRRRAYVAFATLVLACAVGSAIFLALRPKAVEQTRIQLAVHERATARAKPAIPIVGEATPAPAAVETTPSEAAVADNEESPTRVEAVPGAVPNSVRAKARGVVNVATPGGWADVFVAGRRRGRTPLQLELPEGHRSLSLRPFGKGNVKRDVLVRPGQVTRVVVRVYAAK